MPFELAPGAEVHLVNIVMYEKLDVPPGLSTIQVEQWFRADGQRCGRLLFCPGRGEARVLRADPALTRTTDLLLMSDPV